MPRAKVKEEEKIYTYPICLKSKQIDWLNAHPKFKFNLFFRAKLQEAIDAYNEVLELAYDE